MHTLKNFQARARSLRGGLFHRKRPLVYGSAPGWVDLFGGYTGHIEGPAIGWPTEQMGFAAVQLDPAPLLTVQIVGETEPLEAFPIGQMLRDGWPCSYADGRALLAEQPFWLRLVAGCWLALMQEEFVRPAGGARVFLGPHDGPGDRASLAVALTAALCVAFEVRLARRELGLCAATALREVVSAEGPLGSLVAAVGTPGELLVIDGPRCGLFGVRLPEGIAVQIDEPAIRPRLCQIDEPATVAAEAFRARLAVAMLRADDPAQREEQVALVNRLLGESQDALMEVLGAPYEVPLGGGRVAAGGGVVRLVGQ
jgi:hypothetical protein